MALPFQSTMPSASGPANTVAASAAPSTPNAALAAKHVWSERFLADARALKATAGAAARDAAKIAQEQLGAAAVKMAALKKAVSNRECVVDGIVESEFAWLLR